MTSATPPSPYFNGIVYNPSFFTTTTSSYLSYPLAQGTETFSSGILSNSIKTIATSDTLDIATTQLSGALNIASLPSRTGNINIGYSSSTPSGLGYNINMGNILSNTSIGGKYVELVSASSGITLSTSGTLNMIANAFNIGTSSLNATNINIGTTGKTTTTINGPITTTDLLTANGDITSPNITSTTKFKGIAYDAPTALSVLSIGETLTHGAVAAIVPLMIGINIDGTPTKGIQIGNSTTKIGLDGATTALSLTSTGDIKTITGKLIGSTLDAVSDTAAGYTALTIGSNVVLGNIVIGNSQTTGDIIIGASLTFY